MKKLLLIFALLIPFMAQAQTQLLDDIVSGQYRPERLASMTPMSDGEHFAQLEDNAVYVKAYQTGEIVDTLYHDDQVKGTKVRDIEGFVLPPAHKFILLYNNSQRIYRHSFTADYYIYDTQKKKVTVLGKGIQEPVFSPNGRYIAFGRENNLYVHKLDFGTEVAVITDGAKDSIINGTTDWLYEEEFGVTALYAFSPDNKHLAFVRFDETDVPSFRWQDMLTEGYPEEQVFKYPRAGEENAKVSVIVYDMHYKSLQKMQVNAEGDSYIPRIRWAQPQGKEGQASLAIWVLNRDQNQLQMLLGNPKSTVCTQIYHEEAKDTYVDYAQVDEWQFLKDNSFIAVNETDGFRHAYLYSAAGIMQKQLTKGNFDVTQLYGYDEATTTLYYQAATTPITRSVYSLNVKKNKTTLLTSEEGWHNASFSPTFQYWIDDYSSLTTPNRFMLYNGKGQKVREILNNNPLQEKFEALNLPKKEFFTFTTSRGDELNGWMLLPTNFDSTKKYPVLQIQYSGPGSQQVRNRWAIDWEYFLATQGIITVCVDGRGTGARGREWKSETYMNLGIKEAQDQVATAQYMQSLPYVQADKIGIWGWSYGGYMTLMSMSQPEGVFACGIAVAPVTDWSYYDSGYTERFMLTPQINISGYENADVSTLASQLQGRLLLVHGLADDNVHCQNAWKYVEALVQANKQFDMQFYPDDNHFLKKRNNYKHLYNRKWEFLQEYLLGK